jgi:RimJ/RimL family protein N-acetyltransferase
MAQDDLASLQVTRSNPASRIEYRSGEVFVVLRPTRLDDAEALSAAVLASAAELLPFMPWAQKDNSPRAQLERLKTAEADYQAGRVLVMGLFDGHTGAFLSSVGLHPRVPLNPSGLEVGYFTPSAHAGRGWATLGTRIITAYAFEHLGCDRLQVMHDEANGASRRVIEKCGFRFEGLMRNMVARPPPELVAGGYRGTPVSRMYSLVPEDRAALAWYAPLRDALAVYNLAGHLVVRAAQMFDHPRAG